MNPEVINSLVEKSPKLKAARSVLEKMQPGTFCVHRTFGFGEIKDYDEAQNRLIIDFEEGKTGHAMDPAFCVDKLELLPADHVLVLKHKDPEAITSLMKKQPVELIMDILKHYEDQSATTMELERVLARLIGPQKYKKWWTNTKKLLVKDPRVGSPQKKTDPYVFREEPIKPEEEILEQYLATKNPKHKILLAEKLFDLSDGKPELKDELPLILETLTDSIKGSKSLTMADRLHGVWVRNNLARDLHEDVEALQPTSASILDATDDLSQLAFDLPSNYYKRFLDLITRTYPDKWENIIEDLLRKSEGKFTNECINFLLDREQEKRISAALHKWLDEQTIRGPILYWIIKNRSSKKFHNLTDPLMTPRLLSAAFFAIDSEALHSTGTRRIPLADLISEDQKLISDLLTGASTETAQDLAQMLLMNQGFEDLTKKSVLARFIKLYPPIQNLLLSAVSEEKKEEESLIVSQGSYDKAKAEYDDIVKRKIPENKEAIAVAREHGDLRENAEYKMARQEQDILLARKAQLDIDLNRAQVTDFTDAPVNSIGVGSVVELKQTATGTTSTFAILGAWDSNPDENILSYKTPLGQELISKEVGDTAFTEIDGVRQEWKIESIRRWVDQEST